MTRYPRYRRLGGPHGRCGRVRKISPPPGFEPRNVQPVASRYSDYAIPASEFSIPNSTEQSPSWEANTSLATQEIVRILWNRKVHRRIHKSPSPVHTLSQIVPVHAPPPIVLLLENPFNIILPSTPGSFKLSPSLRFPHRNPECTSPLPHLLNILNTSEQNRKISKATFEISNNSRFITTSLLQSVNFVDSAARLVNNEKLPLVLSSSTQKVKTLDCNWDTCKARPWIA